MTTGGSGFSAEQFLKQFGLYNLSKHYEATSNRFGYSLNTVSEDAKLPLIFPRIEAFLFTEETFTWAVESYDVEVHDTPGEPYDVDLINKKLSTFVVKGLGIKQQENKTIVIKDNMERGIDYDGADHPVGVSYYKINDDVPKQLNGEREREITLEGTDLGIPEAPDIAETSGYYSFFKTNKIPHGQLLDMAIYIYED